MRALRALVWWVLLLALGVGLYSDVQWRKRQYERRQRERVTSLDRYVDIGVELRVVVYDPNGHQLLEGRPPMRILRWHRPGWIIDTERGVPFAASQRRVIWYCSEDQEPVILHGDEETLGLYVYGSEGAGKTTILPKWHYWRWLENLGQGREGGAVAPTKKRLRMFLKELRRAFPPSWYRYTKSEELITLCDRSRIQMVSAHQQSKDEGSPIQGYSWSWASGDEDQDMVERHEDIEARGREAKCANYKQVRTATPKDHSAFRAHRARLEASGLWTRRTMLGARSPFIDPKFWEDKKRTMSPREYERRVLAMDVGIELAVYYNWKRARNLAPKPRLATDVTAAILSLYQSYKRPGARFTLACGHDPGVIFNTTEVAQLKIIGDVPTWMVVGEYQTKQTTQREHARGFKKYLQDKFGVELEINGRPDPDSDKALVFADPHGRGAAQTDYASVYGAFQHVGLDVFDPAPLTHRIKRKPRVEMVNRLFVDAAHIVRLLIACDDQGQPAAPVLVESLESLEKQPGDDDPEGSQPKDENDRTHAPAALGYLLWPFEQEALTGETIKRALAAARRSV